MVWRLINLKYSMMSSANHGYGYGVRALKLGGKSSDVGIWHVTLADERHYSLRHGNY